METLIGSDTAFWDVAKPFVLLGLVVYIIFAFVVLRQVKLMNETLEIGFEKSIKAMAYAHLVLVIMLFLFAIVVL